MLDIDFVHVVIHSRSYKNTHLPHVTIATSRTIAELFQMLVKSDQNTEEHSGVIILDSQKRHSLR